MSKKEGHIDFKRLSDYLNGKMNSKERHAFELEALEDPFLYEAIEGYESNPEGFQRIKKLKKDQKASSRSFFGSRTLAVLLVACLAYIITLLVFPNLTTNVAQQNKQTDDQKTMQDQTDSSQEVDIIRHTIDSLHPIALNEQIQVTEITENKKIIQSAPEKEKEEKALVDSVFIQEQPIITEDDKIVPEQQDPTKTIYAPSTYINDLFVVDYRHIERENKSISYTRFELSGLSANYENHDTKDRNDLTQKEVEVPYMEYLNGAMDRFSQKRYKKALNRFLTILEQYPKDLNALFYGGHCYYNLGEYNKAEQFFQNVLKIEREAQFVAFRQEAKWYLSKTYLKLNKTEEAKILLEKIIAEGLFYSKDAIQLLEQLD